MCGILSICHSQIFYFLHIPPYFISSHPHSPHHHCVTIASPGFHSEATSNPSSNRDIEISLSNDEQEIFPPLPEIGQLFLPHLLSDSCRPLTDDQKYRKSDNICDSAVVGGEDVYGNGVRNLLPDTVKNMMASDSMQHNNNSSNSGSGSCGDVNNNENKMFYAHNYDSSACHSAVRQQQTVSISDSDIDLNQDMCLKEGNNLNIFNNSNKLDKHDNPNNRNNQNKLDSYHVDNTVALNVGNLSNVSEKLRVLNAVTLNDSYSNPNSSSNFPCVLENHSCVRTMHDTTCISPPSYPLHPLSSSFSPPSYPVIPSSSFFPPSHPPHPPSTSFSPPYPPIPSSSSFSPQYTASATCISSSLLSTITVTPSIHSPDIPPSSLSALFPSIYNTCQPAIEEQKVKEKEKITIPIKNGNPQLAQTSNFSSFASSFAYSPSSSHSVFSKEILLERQNEGCQNVYNVGNRERSISQLSTPSSFTSSPPSSFNNKSTNVFSEGSSNSPFFSYETLNSALNLNKSRNSLQKCNDKPSSISDLKCSNSNNININNNSNNNINMNNSSNSNINSINNNNYNNNKNDSGNNNATAAVATVSNDVNQDSIPAKKPLAKYPIPCDSVSTVLIHGFLSQGTEYSFFLPPQANNEFIGKRVSHRYSLILSCLI